MTHGMKEAHREARDACGYRTQVYSGPRCSTCAHCRPVAAMFNATSHDRSCRAHLCMVKTHGSCERWLASAHATD
jgi:hypothetical protein